MPTQNSFSRTRTFTFEGETLPPGLAATTHTVVANAPSLLDRAFSPENVFVADGFLQLRVPGGQAGKHSIACAEVATDFDVCYGSIRTWAILSGTDGVCNGMFMYHSDTQETDIEWLGQRQQQPGSFDSGSEGEGKLHFVNQPVSPVSPLTHVAAACPADVTTAVHEYRIDWTPDATAFFVDGALQTTLRDNVPTNPGRWMWNCWTNGNPNWSRGPPVSDAVLKIQKIVLEYNEDDL